MTLQQFQQLTAGLPAHTEILMLDMWGNYGPAAIVTAADLIPGDPALDDFPHDAIVIAEDAELTDRSSLPSLNHQPSTINS